MVFNFLKKPGNEKYQSFRYYDHYWEKQNHSARTQYISPILQQYYKSVKQNVIKDSIGKSIDGFKY